jgi:hypothetical protein
LCKYLNTKFREIVNKCRIEFMFCDNYKRAQEYIEKAGEIPTLKHIVLLKSDKENPVPNGEVENSKINVSKMSFTRQNNHLCLAI